MPLFGLPALVRPYFGYRNAERLVLVARALRMREANWERSGTLRKVHAVLSQFASDEVPGLKATLEVAGEGQQPLAVSEISDSDGYLRFDLPFRNSRDLPETPAWEVAKLRWTNRRGAQAVDAYILAPGRNGKLAVISDIDDTIIETGAGKLARNWRRIFAQMPGEREVVPGAVEFYGRLGGGTFGDSVPASRRPFFYVSSSPWNLFDYLVAFQKAKGLPQGPVLLRNWGLDRATFGHGSHGAHKADAIRALAAFYPELRFALIGDDTQADALAYAAAVSAHPGRIAGVFIRQAPQAGISAAEQAALDSIAAAGVPLWCGTAYEVGSDFLGTLGFTEGGETAQIVAATEEGSVGTKPDNLP